jgi:hypothetical protein
MDGILRSGADASPLVSFHTNRVGPRSRGEPPGCQSTEAGSPATGRVQAGGTYAGPGTGKSYAGYSPFGALAFEATPTDCQTGVSSAGIEAWSASASSRPA